MQEDFQAEVASRVDVKWKEGGEEPAAAGPSSAESAGRARPAHLQGLLSSGERIILEVSK